MGRNRTARPGAKLLRLFAAVDLPPSHQDVVDDALAPWRERFPQGRWERREKWHVTLKFMGRTWPRLVGMVEEACRATAVSIEPFRVRPSHLGVFPGPRRARVLWVGLDDPGEGLAGLAAGLEHRLAEDFPPEKRAFTPHLTVARFRDQVTVDPEELAAAAVEAPAFEVDRLLLYRSHLMGPRGSRYEVVGEFRLGR
jgi:RNA 2',3'-cyclic 3'-phosphodiesterase